MRDEVCNYLTEINRDDCCVEDYNYSEEGKGVALKLRKNQEAKFIKIDGCIINTGKKCDCLVLFKASKSKRYAFFVELKGGANEESYARAISQISETSKNNNVIEILRKSDISDVSRKAIIITGPKTQTNRPAKDMAEVELNMRLEVVKQEKYSKHYNLRDSKLIK